MAVCKKYPEIVEAYVPEPNSVHAWYKFYAYVKPNGLKVNFESG